MWQRDNERLKTEELQLDDVDYSELAPTAGNTLRRRAELERKRVKDDTEASDAEDDNSRRHIGKRDEIQERRFEQQPRLLLPRHIPPQKSSSSSTVFAATSLPVDPLKWTRKDVLRWMKDVMNLPEYTHAGSPFRSMDGRELLRQCASKEVILKRLNVHKRIHATKIHREVQCIRTYRRATERRGDVYAWTSHDVIDWLEMDIDLDTNVLSVVIDAFGRESVDGEMLLFLTEEDLRDELDVVEEEDRRILLRAIENLRKKSSTYRNEIGETVDNNNNAKEKDQTKKTKEDIERERIRKRLEEELRHQARGKQLLNATKLHVTDEPWEHGFVREDSAAGEDPTVHSTLSAFQYGDEDELAETSVSRRTLAETFSFSRLDMTSERVVIPRHIELDAAVEILRQAIKDSALLLAKRNGVLGLDPHHYSMFITSPRAAPSAAGTGGHTKMYMDFNRFVNEVFDIFLERAGKEREPDCSLSLMEWIEGVHNEPLNVETRSSSLLKRIFYALTSEKGNNKSKNTRKFSRETFLEVFGSASYDTSSQKDRDHRNVKRQNSAPLPSTLRSEQTISPSHAVAEKISDAKIVREAVHAVLDAMDEAKESVADVFAGLLKDPKHFDPSLNRAEVERCRSEETITPRVFLCSFAHWHAFAMRGEFPPPIEKYQVENTSDDYAFVASLKVSSLNAKVRIVLL